MKMRVENMASFSSKWDVVSAYYQTTVFGP